MIKTNFFAKKHKTHKQQSGGAQNPFNNKQLHLATMRSIANEQRKKAMLLQEQKAVNEAIRQSLQQNANIPPHHRGAVAARPHANANRVNNNTMRKLHKQYNNITRKHMNNNNAKLKTIQNIKNYLDIILQKQQQCEINVQASKVILQTTDISLRYVHKQYNYIWDANSCYLHSALQLFKNIPELIKTIKSPSIKSPVLELCSRELRRHGLPTYSSIELIENVMQHITFTDGQTQIWGTSYDTIEFILNILGNLHISELPYMSFRDKTYTFNKDETLRGILSVQSYLLLLSLNESLYNNIQAILLQQIIAIETIDSRIFKTTNYEITDSTKYILIQLAIFELTQSGRYKKKHIKITNLNDVLCINDIMFELISIIVHIGTFKEGHYINFSKQYNHKTNKCNWYKYDDITKDANPVNLGPLLTLPAEDNIPYILLYNKII